MKIRNKRFTRTIPGPGSVRAFILCAVAFGMMPLASAQAPFPGIPAPAPAKPGLIRKAPQPAVANADAGDEAENPSTHGVDGMPLDDGQPRRLKFSNAPITMLMDAYAEATGRTMLLSPTLPTASVNLRSQTDLTLGEYLDAIETVLGMHGVALLREGEKFLRVVPSKDARREPMQIRTDPTTGETVSIRDSGQLISQLIPLKHIEIAEAQKAIEPLKHDYGTVHTFDSINAVLLTDSAATVKRVEEMIQFIDQPVLAREKPFTIQIRYAKASEIKQKLMEIVTEAQKDQAASTIPRQRESGAPGIVRQPVTAREATIIRPRTAVAREGSTTESAASGDPDEGDKGLIRGNVKIIEDDRTNMLILITREDNMEFFRTIIKVLDVETAPDVEVRIYRLEYAESKDVAGMLNDLIGAAASDDEVKAPDAVAGDGETGRYEDLAERAQRRTAESQPSAAPVVAKSKVGELSAENVKILSDERTNSLIVMASRSDHAALEEIIGDMDTMLSQVLVETVILEINLGDTIDTGVDWIQRAFMSVEEGPNGRKPVSAWAGSGGGGGNAVVDPMSLTSISAFPAAGAGLTYYMTLFDLNIDMVLQAVATDSRARVLSSPVIVTMDNKAAKIDVATERYFFKGNRYAGGTGDSPVYEPDVDVRAVGINLSVTPRINDKDYVVMEIVQKIEDVIGEQRIGDDDWPIVSSRNLEAEVALRSGETIVLGGLMQNRDLKSRSKVPILGDIPLLGLPFRSDSKEKGRTELIVFLTPYVLDSPADIVTDTARRQDAMHLDGMWQRGWSNSRFAEPRNLDPAQPPAGVSAEPAGKSSPRSRSLVDALRRPGDAAPAEAAASKYVEWDPMAGLDPEIRADIEREEAKWDAALERADRKLGGRVGGR